MRSLPRRIPLLLLALTLAGTALALGGCGQTGPLYLPPPKPRHPAAQAAPARTAAPAPAAATR